jgi:hypothetical protein
MRSSTVRAISIFSEVPNRRRDRRAFQASRARYSGSASMRSMLASIGKQDGSS